MGDLRGVATVSPRPVLSRVSADVYRLLSETAKANRRSKSAEIQVAIEKHLKVAA